MLEIVQAISTYGVVPVLIAFVLWFWIHTTRKQNEMNQKQQEMNKAQQEANRAQEERLMGVLTSVMTSVTQIHHNTDTRHSLEEEENNRKVDILINAQLQKLQAQTGANRVACFRYHNGGKDMTGRSFQKMSMSYEIVDFATAPVSLSYQNIPRTLYTIFNQKVAEQGCYYVENLEDIKEIDPTTYGWFTGRKIQSVFVGAIKATNDLVLGYVTLEFMSLFKGDLVNLKKCLKNKTTKISTALELQAGPKGDEKL